MAGSGQRCVALGLWAGVSPFLKRGYSGAWPDAKKSKHCAKVSSPRKCLRESLRGRLCSTNSVFRSQEVPCTTVGLLTAGPRVHADPAPPPPLNVRRHAPSAFMTQPPPPPNVTVWEYLCRPLSAPPPLALPPPLPSPPPVSQSECICVPFVCDGAKIWASSSSKESFQPRTVPPARAFHLPPSCARLGGI